MLLSGTIKSIQDTTRKDMRVDRDVHSSPNIFKSLTTI